MVNNHNLRTDRGTSQILPSPVTGGQTLTNITFAPTDGAPATFTGPQMVSFPAGTAVRGGVDTLGGYRLYFSAGSREANGALATTAGVMDLTPDGQELFRRAVLLALNSGGIPGPEVPTLELSLAGGQVTLTWDQPNWFLEQSSTLAAESWLSAVGTSPVTLPATEAQQFFRLRYEP